MTSGETPPRPTEAALLSRILWCARENLDMWADVVQIRTGQDPESVRSLIAEIDDYRAERGWSAHGFGNEPDEVKLVPLGGSVTNLDTGQVLDFDGVEPLRVPTSGRYEVSWRLETSRGVTNGERMILTLPWPYPFGGEQ